MARINNLQITRKMSRSKKVSGALQTTAERKFRNAQKELIDDFESHPVTRAIESKNGDAGLLGGKGSLWGYLGFDDGSEPIDQVRAQIRTAAIRSNGRTEVKQDVEVRQRFIVEYPSEEDIERSTSLSWGGGSWVRAIERGMSGLARFIYWNPGASKGRSGAGVQAKNNLRGADSNKTVPYLSPMIRKFKDRIKSKFKV